MRVRINKKKFLPVYHHTLTSTQDIEFFYGSRDSGKSRHVSQLLVVKCLSEKYFFCPMIRKVSNTVKDSQYQLIKNVIDEWGLNAYFSFVTSPQPEIRCINGNRFIGRGMDDARKVKSIANPSHAWLEECSDLSQDDWVLILTSLRTNVGRVQVFASFNPDIEGNYEEAYLYKTFFAGHSDLSFTHKLELEVDGKKSSITYRATHSTYKDNPYCTPERSYFYESLKNVSEYEYKVYALGLFGRRISGNKFWYGFDLKTHVKTVKYNPNYPVYISIDNNVMPYIAVSLWQVIKRDDGVYDINVFKELPCSDPNNTARKSGEVTAQYLRSIGCNHRLGLFGDISTKSRNSIDDQKRSFSEIFQDALIKHGYEVVNRMLSSAPSVALIGDFVNSIFNQSLRFAQINVSDTCKLIINDLIEVQQDADGTMLKKRVKNPKTGMTYEDIGHYSDNCKDLIVSIFHDKFKEFKVRFNDVKLGGISKHSQKPKFTM